MKCVNIKLWVLLGCLHFILNAPRIYLNTHRRIVKIPPGGLTTIFLLFHKYHRGSYPPPPRSNWTQRSFGSRGGGVRTCTSISKETYIHVLFQRGAETLHPPLNPPVTQTKTEEDLSLGFPIQYYSRHSAVGYRDYLIFFM